jgi:hypothetical protein
MKQMLKKTGLYVVAAVVLAGPGVSVVIAQTADSGTVSDTGSETRTVEAGIARVSVQGPIDLKLKQGTTPSLTLRGERRILPNIATVRDGDTLRIQAKGHFTTRQPIVAEVTLPTLQAVQSMGSGNTDINDFSGDTLTLGMSGSGDLRCECRYQVLRADLRGSGGLKFHNTGGERVEINLFGSGNVDASGKVGTLLAKIMGSGNVNARQLQADTSTVSIFGTGDAQVYATNAVAVSSRGTGNVVVYGKPAQRAVSISGTGSVRWEP